MSPRKVYTWLIALLLLPLGKSTIPALRASLGDLAFGARIAADTAGPWPRKAERIRGASTQIAAAPGGKRTLDKPPQVMYPMDSCMAIR